MDHSVFWLGDPIRAELLQVADLDLAVSAVPLLDDDFRPAVIIVESASVELLGTLPRSVRKDAVIIALAPCEQTIPLLRAGADDVLSPAIGIDELVLRVRRWAVWSRHRREARELASQTRSLEAKLAQLRNTEDQLRALAVTDELTGLSNRRGFRQRLELWLAVLQRHAGELSLVMIDLDDFKAVNDRGGHAAGDKLLCDVGRVLRQSIRTMDQAARLGGDEFALLLPATMLDRATLVAERIRRRLHVNASFGVACAVGAQKSKVAGDELLARADAALYRAKRVGKGVIQVARVLSAAPHHTVA